MKFPYNWQPNVLPLQLISIGNFNVNGNKKSALLIAALPGEFTTMSGRRLRNRIHKLLNEGFIPAKQDEQPAQQVSNLMGDNDQQMINNNDYSVTRQKRYLHFYRFLPINRMQAFSDRMHSLSDSYLMQQNQPLQINDKSPPVENMQTIPSTVDPNPGNVNDQQLNKTLDDASYVKETSTELNGDGYLNVNRVILSGLSNTYSSYVTTFEEYQHQRYEAASTAFGAYTLAAYIQEFSELVNKLMDPNLNLSRSSIEEDEIKPPNLLSKQFQFKPGVIYDGVKINAKYGDLIMDVKTVYKLGEMVKVIFRSGHPQNWNAVEKTYLTVELYDEKFNKWKIVATDASWETK